MTDFPWLSAILTGFTAYAIGCVNTGYLLVSRLAGLDIRAVYSGTAGARNAGRVLGRWGFGAVLAGDASKGALVVISAAVWLSGHPMRPWLAPLVVAGHIWPAQLAFRGGKGVATFLGALAAFLLMDPAGDLEGWAGMAAAFALVVFAHRGHLARGHLSWSASPAANRLGAGPERIRAKEEERA